MNISNVPVLRKLEYRYGPYLFGNTLGFAINRTWYKFVSDCKKVYPAKTRAVTGTPAAKLQNQGLAVIGKTNVDELASQVEAYFESDKQVYAAMNSADALKLAPQVFKVIQSVQLEVEAFFGSYFQPYWISIQKTSPGPTSTASSFGWHTDDNPKEMIKLFVYLNDVFESNGAFRAFPWNVSKKMLRDGFRSNSEMVRMANHEKINDFLEANPKSLIVLEGPKGTVLGFDNNLVHKGTAPREGYRLAIQIPVIPSMTPISLEQVEKALQSHGRRDYPVNPYVNDYGS